MDARTERMYGDGRKYQKNTRRNGGFGIIDGLDALYIAWAVITIIVAIITGGTVLLL